jgi:hypothetical protein
MCDAVIDIKSIPTRPPIREPNRNSKRVFSTLTHQFTERDGSYVRTMITIYVALGIMSMISVIMSWIFIFKLLKALANADTIKISFNP